MGKMTLDWNEYVKAARNVISEGCVLLENQGVLPLGQGTKVSVFGRIALDYYKSGTGSGGMVNVSKVYTIIDGLKESGVVERLSKTVQNELNNIVVIFLGTTVGATASAEAFLNFQTLSILCVGILAFGFGTAGGVLLAKFMNLFLKDKINPLIGSAGVSAVPMAARVSQVEGAKADPRNFLLMHAMGPNVAGVIGSAVAAGILLAFLG